MAILITNDGDKVVETIAARDAITARFPGMKVTVLDAIADVLTGGGEAGYEWNASFSRWMLIWKTSKDNLNFITEEKTIINGKVNATYFPSNGTVWNCLVVDSNNIVLAEIKQPTVLTNEVNIGSTAYDANKLIFTYGYGLIEAAVYAASDRGWQLVSADLTATSGDRLLVDTSAAPVSITLPANPQFGAFVKIADYASNFELNSVTVLRNGENITGVADDVLLNITDYAVMFVYSGASKGWVYGI